MGFSQRIQLEWLDETARLLREGKTEPEIRSALKEDILRQRLSVGSTAKKGNRQKATCILMRTWVTVPARAVALRDRALELLTRGNEDDRLILHWGLCMVVYPFFTLVAGTTGRLLRLQGAVAQSQVLSRLWKQIGQRPTVTRATQRLLRSFVDWGVLVDASERGIYRSGPTRSVADPALTAWLVEAALMAANETQAPLNALRRNPALFPFSLKALTAGVLSRQARLEVYRQALDEEMVALLHT